MEIQDFVAELRDLAMQCNIRLVRQDRGTGWLRLVGSLKLYVSFAKEPYKRDNILN